MVRLLAASASLTLAFAARINLESAGDLDLDESAVSSETVVAQILTSTEADEETTDGPVRRCAEPSRDPSRDGRRRGRRDCGCLPDGSHECFPDDEGQYCDHWIGSSSRSPACRRRRSASRPAPAPRRPTPPPAPPPEYIPGSGRFWEIGSHRSSGTANSPGTVANGWYDPNSEFMLAQSPPENHDGEAYPLAAMTRHDSHDPHHCNSGWASCCNTEFNCCANCPLQNADRPEWGPRGWSQCLGWFPQCGTDAPHPNLPSAPAPSPPGEGGFGGFGDFGGDGGMPGFGGGMPGFGGGGAMPVPGPPPPSMGHHPPPGFGGGTAPNPFGGGFGGFGGFR